jgi:uncharacterized protein Yka (UPF0111/DUF47 family)
MQKKSLLDKIKGVIFPANIDYFAMFVTGAEISLRAAEALKSSFHDQHVSRDELLKVKEIEHEGDHHMHISLRVVEDAFIIPIDQSDLIDILKAIESVTDHIDYVAAHLYMLNINESDAYLNKFMDILILCNHDIVELMKLLRRFKTLNMDEIYKLILRINTLEEEADRNYLDSMRHLFTTDQDPVEIIKRKEIYQRFEDAIDRAEDVANAVERLLVAKL